MVLNDNGPTPVKATNSVLVLNGASGASRVLSRPAAVPPTLLAKFLDGCKELESYRRV